MTAMLRELRCASLRSFGSGSIEAPRSGGIHGDLSTSLRSFGSGSIEAYELRAPGWARSLRSFGSGSIEAS